MLLSMIAAVAENGVIGADNQLPWHIPEDLKYFKQMTLGKPIIMGRKTFDSIVRPLPGRLNIVITRQPEWCADGVEVVTTLPAALAIAEDYCRQNACSEAMIVGGAGIYELALPQAQRLYLTEVHQQVAGDTFFPALDAALWQEVSRSEATDGSCTFKVLERASKNSGASQ